MNKKGHKCLVCFTFTQRKHLCDVCLRNHEKTNCYENLIREWEANRSWTTRKAYNPYLDAVRELVRDVPVSKKTKTKFVASMATAYRKELDL